MRKLAKKTWIFAAVLLLSALLTEVVIRAVSPQPASVFSVYSRHPRLPLYTLDRECELTLDNGETQWTVRTDEHGFRVPRAFARREADGRGTILVIGGTNTFGYSVNYEDSYSGLLEQEYSGFRIWNAAVPKYGPVQYRMVLADLLNQGFRPDVLIVGFCPGTDFGHASSNKDVVPVNGMLRSRRGIKYLLKTHTHSYRLAARTYHRLFTGSDPTFQAREKRLYSRPDWGVEPLATESQIVRSEARRIRDMAQDFGFRLVFVITPTAGAVQSFRDNAAAGVMPSTDLPSRQVCGILHDLGIEVINPVAAVAQLPVGTTHYRFDRHLTPSTHRVIFESLRKTLADTHGPLR